MRTTTSQKSRGGKFPGRLRWGILFTVVAGAGGSLGLTLYAGRRNPSLLLIALFAIWVLSPFAGLLLADAVSRRRPIPAQPAVNGLMLILTLGSLAIYGSEAFGLLNAKLGFVFLMVPFASWLLIAIVVLLGALASRQQPTPNNRA